MAGAEGDVLGGVGRARAAVKSRSNIVALPRVSITRTVNWCGPVVNDPGLSVHWNGPLVSAAFCLPSTRNSTRLALAAASTLASTSVGPDSTALSARPLSVALGGGVFGTLTTRSSKLEGPA